MGVPLVFGPSTRSQRDHGVAESPCLRYVHVEFSNMLAQQARLAMFSWDLLSVRGSCRTLCESSPENYAVYINMHHAPLVV